MILHPTGGKHTLWLVKISKIMKILTDFFLILFALFSVNNLNGQKDLRVGYIDMDYILKEH